MENSSINFAENIAEDALSEDQYSAFYTEAVDPKEPGDDEEEEEQDQDQEEDKGQSGEDDNPPLDPDVVHSPVTTQSGGMPKRN